jgi:hypothetical protein
MDLEYQDWARLQGRGPHTGGRNDHLVGWRMWQSLGTDNDPPVDSKLGARRLSLTQAVAPDGRQDRSGRRPAGAFAGPSALRSAQALLVCCVPAIAPVRWLWHMLSGAGADRRLLREGAKHGQFLGARRHCLTRPVAPEGRQDR